MYDFLKNIATVNDWEWQYARKDFHNLYDKEEQLNKVHIFVDPIRSDDVYGDYGEIEGQEYSGSFMLLYSSDIDEPDYEYRYQQYIKPLVEDAFQIIKDAFSCSNEFGIVSTSKIEVINVLDYNFDGIIVNYTAKSE